MAMGKVAFTAPHHQAAEVGLGFLREGASAVDAMIAAAATIAVVYPHMNSLGGDGFWLIHKPGAAPVAIDACGTAANAATPQWYQDQAYGSIPARGGPAALCMAGTLEGWRCAGDWDKTSGNTSSLSLGELLAPAAALARDGITVTGSLQLASEKVAEELSGFEAFQSLFCPQGRTLQQGDTLRNAAFSEFLVRLGAAGPEDFYRGKLASEVCTWLQSCGSPLQEQDFKDYRAQLLTPLSVRTHDATLYNLPAPTQGIASLLILAIYDRLCQIYQPVSESDHVHFLVESTKQAFLIRDREVTDPSRLSAQWNSLLGAENIDRCVLNIDPAQAMPWPHTAMPGDTVWMGARDADGCMVSFIQSVYWEFGSGLVMPELGLVWNNRGMSFSLEPGHLNHLQPGLKPFHTLNPAFAIFDDGSRLSYGTMGGEGQPQTQAALFSRFRYQGYTLADAIARSRWLLGRTWGDSNNDLKFEEELSTAIGAGMEDRGHSIKTVAGKSELMGHAGAVFESADNVLTAATDPRSDGAGLVA